jgi:hypothetical protein
MRPDSMYWVSSWVGDSIQGFDAAVCTVGCFLIVGMSNRVKPSAHVGGFAYAEDTPGTDRRTRGRPIPRKHALCELTRTRQRSLRAQWGCPIELISRRTVYENRLDCLLAPNGAHLRYGYSMIPSNRRMSDRAQC